MQDTGDPRHYSYPDPSNRKIYFGHDIEVDGGGVNIIQVATTGSLSSYAYSELSDESGNVLPIILSGVQTLCLTALSANNNLQINFLFFLFKGGPKLTVQKSRATIIVSWNLEELWKSLPTWQDGQRSQGRLT